MTSSNRRLSLIFALLPAFNVSPFYAPRRDPVTPAYDVELATCRIAGEVRWHVHEMNVRSGEAMASSVGAVDQAP
jgi:hypothetical protein